MSKRESTGLNTLFNYFTKLSGDSNGSTPGKNENNLKDLTPKKRKPETSESEDEDLNIEIKPTKRKRIVNRIDSDSSEDENEESVSKIKALFDAKIPKKPKILSQNETNESLNIINNNTPKKNKQNSKTTSEHKSADNSESEWLHNRLEFLKSNKIRDKNGKAPSHPDYDPRTLYVPNEYLDKLTPAMRQWWIIKRDHFDCVLFFKVGKFYELYHMDAVIGVQELGFSFMKGEFAHSGFPESAYGRMLSSLVELGYKVARVEQTETPEIMNERLKKTPGSNKFSKVVKREVCQITNKGTRIQGQQDIDIKQPLSFHLLAVIEKQRTNKVEFGVCFVDTSIGQFYIGQFEDDDRFSRLLTMLAQYPPAVILEERRQLSSQVRNMLKNSSGNASLESLTAESQFYTSNKTLTKLIEGEYFKNKETGKVVLPMVLQEMIVEDDSLNTTSKKEFDLALRCLGACMWYLKDCLLDIQILSLGKFDHYIPSDLNNYLSATASKFMVLDSRTLSGLNLIGSNVTLEATLDHCSTPFGKRLLHQWVCRPVCNIEEIKNRQEAISELLNRNDILQDAPKILSSLPDLERLISKIHWMGNPLKAKNHPDSRAILYEEKTYSKKKIQDFLLALNGFEEAATLCHKFSDVTSKILRKHICLAEGSLYPDLLDTIKLFKNSFDVAEAQKDGKIVPQYGVDAEYDETIDEINSIKVKLDKYLKSQENFFACKLSYTGTDRKRFQLEVPEHATHRANRHYFLEGTKKGSKPSKRYSTNETKSLLALMMAAEAKNREILKDLNRKIFEKFSAKYDDWNTACYCLSVIDVLLSFTKYVQNQSVNICVPEILPFNPEPVLTIKDGVHPFIPNIENFVPNDTDLGTDKHQTVLILTGPNMGGKSTLMRQAALLTVMAQIGCHVPASEMKLTLVDRIFTRLGAHDDIIAGNSTFFVELSEASAILQHSTYNSLVLLDELGRGTSTYDGTAIATAYVDRLLKINCRTIFSTHYYSLLDYFKNNKAIQLGHMACKVESDESDVTQETVLFLYKMISGPCPKSYGFNAARLAGIPNCITKRAHEVSKKFEVSTISRKVFRAIMCDEENITDLLNVLNI